jgi:hypothetical protein
MKYAAVARPHRQDHIVKAILVTLGLAIGAMPVLAMAQATPVCTTTGPLCVAPLDLSGATEPASPLLRPPVLPVSGSTTLPSPFSIAPGGPLNPVIRAVPLVGVFR